MHPNLSLITLACCSLLLSNCASIVSKSNWPVTLSSNPSGASVMVANKQGVNIHSATTPTTVTLESDAGFFRRAHYTMTFTKPGYPTRTALLRAKMNRWYVGNIVFGGLIGILIVDPATGAMWTSPPAELPATLAARGHCASSSAPPCLRLGKVI